MKKTDKNERILRKNNKLKNKNSNFVILDIYDNNKVVVKCLIHDYIFVTGWSNILNQKGCMLCYKDKNKTNFKEILKFIEDKNMKLINIHNKHLKQSNHKFRVELMCNICKNIFIVSWMYFKNRNSRCSECNKIKLKYNRINKKKNDILREIKKFNCVIKNGIDEFTDKKTSVLTFCCNNKHQWNATFETLKRQNGCPKCSEILINKYTFEYIKYYMRLYSCMPLIYKDEYKDSHSYFYFLCKCGNYDKISFEEFIKHKKCKSCRGLYKKYSYDFIYDMLYGRNMILLSEKFYFMKKDTIRFICKCGNISNKLLYRWFISPQCNNCSIENRSGECHHDWDNGISEIRKYLRDRMKSYTNHILKRDNNMCVLTGNSDSIVVHHLLSFNLLLKQTLKILGLEIKNNIGEYSFDEIKKIKKILLNLHYKHNVGICINTEIHNLFHSIYGYGNNTKDQFVEFLNNIKLNKFHSYFNKNKIRIINTDINI